MIATSSGSTPHSRANRSRTPSFCGSRIFHSAIGGGIEFEKSRWRRIASCTHTGEGETPPLFRFTTLWSTVKARTIGAQWSSSRATSSGVPATAASRSVRLASEPKDRRGRTPAVTAG